MRFDTAQVLDLICVPKETLRHWKTVLPPIQKRDGRSAKYTFAEVVALAVIAAAVQGLAIPVSRFTQDADWLFETIASRLDGEPSLAYLFILPEEMKFDADLHCLESAVVCVVALPMVVALLKSKLAQTNDKDAPSQLAFQF